MQLETLMSESGPDPILVTREGTVVVEQPATGVAFVLTLPAA